MGPRCSCRLDQVDPESRGWPRCWVYQPRKWQEPCPLSVQSRWQPVGPGTGPGTHLLQLQHKSLQCSHTLLRPSGRRGLSLEVFLRLPCQSHRGGETGHNIPTPSENSRRFMEQEACWGLRCHRSSSPGAKPTWESLVCSSDSASARARRSSNSAADLVDKSSCSQEICCSSTAFSCHAPTVVCTLWAPQSAGARRHKQVPSGPCSGHDARPAHLSLQGVHVAAAHSLCLCVPRFGLRVCLATREIHLPDRAGGDRRLAEAWTCHDAGTASLRGEALDALLTRTHFQSTPRPQVCVLDPKQLPDGRQS